VVAAGLASGSRSAGLRRSRERDERDDKNAIPRSLMVSSSWKGGSYSVRFCGMYQSRKNYFAEARNWRISFALFLVADPREELRTQLDDGLWSVEWETLVHLSAREVARLAALLEDRADLLREIDRWRRRIEPEEDQYANGHEIEPTPLQAQPQFVTATVPRKHDGFGSRSVEVGQCVRGAWRRLNSERLRVDSVRPHGRVRSSANHDHSIR